MLLLRVSALAPPFAFPQEAYWLRRTLLEACPDGELLRHFGDMIEGKWPSLGAMTSCPRSDVKHYLRALGAWGEALPSAVPPPSCLPWPPQRSVRLRSLGSQASLDPFLAQAFPSGRPRRC